MTTTSAVTKRLEGVKKIILVLSGKGGVGKSTVACELARGLSLKGRVGLLDVDLTGPSIPRMMGVEGQSVHQSSEGWVPVYVDGVEGRLGCMSVGFLVKKKGESVVWRGPKKNGMIRQFLGDVRWGEIEYLVIDTPPGKRRGYEISMRLKGFTGTSDEHLALMEHLSGVMNRVSCVIVTTPQAVAVSDAQKSVSFARAVGMKIGGLIENMSGYTCPCCGEFSRMFSTGGGEEMAKREEIEFLGRVAVNGLFIDIVGKLI